jgi:hypothetical protein
VGADTSHADCCHTRHTNAQARMHSIHASTMQDQQFTAVIRRNVPSSSTVTLAIAARPPASRRPERSRCRRSPTRTYTLLRSRRPPDTARRDHEDTCRGRCTRRAARTDPWEQQPSPRLSPGIACPTLRTAARTALHAHTNARAHTRSSATRSITISFTPQTRRHAHTHASARTQACTTRMRT